MYETPDEDEFWGRRTPSSATTTVEMRPIGIRARVCRHRKEPDWAWALMWFGCGVFGAAMLLLYLVVFRR